MPHPALSDADRKIADDFIAWARSHETRTPQFADPVRLILGSEARSEIAVSPTDRSTWVFEVESWRGYEGPFKPLNHLAAPANVEVTPGGSYGHCSTPTTDLPAGLASLRRITIQPDAPCLSWYSISLFLNQPGEIVAVVFDTSEP